MADLGTQRSQVNIEVANSETGNSSTTVPKATMTVKKRYFGKEEKLLYQLKSTHAGESWDTIAELYNAKIEDKSRQRTGSALQMKFKKIRARQRRLAKKAHGDTELGKARPLEDRMIQSWYTPSHHLIAVQEEAVEYNISLLQVSIRRWDISNRSDGSNSGISELCWTISVQ